MKTLTSPRVLKILTKKASVRSEFLRSVRHLVSEYRKRDSQRSPTPTNQIPEYQRGTR